MEDRRKSAKKVREAAAELAANRPHPQHMANGDEQRFAADRCFMSFTKGLPHHPETGLLADEDDFRQFRRAVDEGEIDPFTARVRHGARFAALNDATVHPLGPQNVSDDYRRWEAPTAGLVFDLEAPDAQSVTMAPAPALLAEDGSENPELVFEMGEVYELAILRDVPLNEMESGGADPVVDHAIERLNALEYIGGPRALTGRPRKLEGGALTRQTVFRGSSPGVDCGPYLSQFMLMGTQDLAGGGSPADGVIAYGSIGIDLRVSKAQPTNFMVTMDDYVEMQRGLKPAAAVPYDLDGGRVVKRFITTPRDLATYVHFDALYEAYLNACLTLLAMGSPLDPGFDHLSGGAPFSGVFRARRNTTGFALYGGPHVLTLVTEVATRALKAVRYQKFNNHLRLRPEALAARIELVRRAPGLDAASAATVPPTLLAHAGRYRDALLGNGAVAAASTLETIEGDPNLGNGTYLLPMAFPEGSPMHPSYGAGHATVAGACVTILKAFFDTNAVLATDNDGATRFKRREPGDQPAVYRAPGSAAAPLTPSVPTEFLTLEGELNKLAANVSIGRNMAGVHYFTDYYDSLRMGEKIAIGMLEEQALTYPRDPFVMSIPTFDSDVVTIGRR